MGDTTLGQVRIGEVLSSTKIVLLHVDVLPQLSVAVQILVILYSLGHEPGVVVVVNVTATEALQASVAVALPKDGTAGHSIGETTVGQVIAGGVLSITTTERLHVAVLPQSSVAVQVRVTVLACAQGPLITVTVANVIVTVASQASVAVALPNAGLVGQFIGDVTLGQFNIGGVLSSTTIVRLQVATLPQSSVAVQVLVMLYS